MEKQDRTYRHMALVKQRRVFESIYESLFGDDDAYRTRPRPPQANISRLLEESFVDAVSGVFNYEMNCEKGRVIDILLGYAQDCGVDSRDIMGGLYRSRANETIMDIKTGENIPLREVREKTQILWSLVLQRGLDYIDRFIEYNNIDWDAKPQKREDVLRERQKKFLDNLN